MLYTHKTSFLTGSFPFYFCILPLKSNKSYHIIQAVNIFPCVLFFLDCTFEIGGKGAGHNFFFLICKMGVQCKSQGNYED